jgi:hypothetical protein
MLEIDKSLEVKSSVESVWKQVGDVGNEHKNWHILKDVKVLKKTENSVEREVKIPRGPMGDVKSLQTLTIDPTKKVTTLTMTKGPMLGTRKISLTKLGDNETKIAVDWNFEMKGVPGFALGFVKDNISDATEKALEQIAKAARSDKSVGIPVHSRE